MENVFGGFCRKTENVLSGFCRKTGNVDKKSARFLSDAR